MQNRLLIAVGLLFSLNLMANDYHCVGIGDTNKSNSSQLWLGRELTFRFLDAVDLKFIDEHTGEIMPLTLERVYTTGNRYIYEDLHFFMSSGLISTFKPVAKGKINLTKYDQSGQLIDYAQLDCVLTYSHSGYHD